MLDEAAAWDWLDEPKVNRGRSDDAIIRIVDVTGHVIANATAGWLKEVSGYLRQDTEVEVPKAAEEGVVMATRTILSLRYRIEEMENENVKLRIMLHQARGVAR